MNAPERIDPVTLAVGWFGAGVMLGLVATAVCVLLGVVK